MQDLFDIVTYPLEVIWNGISSIVIGDGLTASKLIISGLILVAIISVIFGISISGSRIRGVVDKHE